MRLLHVVPGLSPQFGGPTLAVLEMCRALNKHGVRSDIATTNAELDEGASPALEQPVELSGVTAYFFNSPFLHKYGYSPRLVRWLRLHLREFDLVHLHSFFSYVTWPVSRYARRYHVPYVLRPVGQLNPWPLTKNRLMKRLYLDLVGMKCLDRAAVIHSTSEDEKLAVQRLGCRSRSVVIPHGLDVAHDLPAPEPGSFRRKHGCTQPGALILFLARLDPIKGLDQLIPAIQRLAQKRDDFFLVLAGSGKKHYEATLRALVDSYGVADRIYFAGFMQGEEKRALLQDADLFVLPSYSENFGFAAVEAMAEGIPVVISRHVGIEPLVREAGAGIVTECDSVALAAALERFLDDPALRRSMGDNGKRLVREKLGWDQVSSELLAVYSSILQGEKRV